MKSKKQRYWLVFHARIDEAVSSEQRHACFFAGIKDLPQPWGLGERTVPPVPDFKRSSSAIISLTKFFGDGVHRAMLNYKYRRLLRDDGLSDDLLTITFDPAKVDAHHLVYTVIPKYIEAFDAYLVEYFDDAMLGLAAHDVNGIAVNPRSIVHRVGVVSFFDELLCRRAFNLSPAEVVERLHGKVEYVQLINGGVYLVGTSQILHIDDALNLCQEMKNCLTCPPVGAK